MPQTWTLPRQVAVLDGVVAPFTVATFFQTATSTPQAVYTDAALTNAVTSITADSAGVFQKVYLNPNAAANYRVTLTPPNGTPYTEDDISGAAAEPFHIRTSAEQTASVTPTNFAYAEGVLERYGLVGDGVTDDSAAFANAALVSAQGVRLLGRTGATYRLASGITVGSHFDLDLRGATIKPAGNFRAIASSSPAGISATTSKTVSSGATRGSRQVVVADATSLALGQWVIFESADTAYQSGSWPRCYARIIAIAGTTITIDTPLSVTYSTGGTITMHAYNDALYGDLFRLVGGSLDLSQSTYTTSGAGIGISGYKRVELDLKVVNQDTTSTASTAIQTVNCLDISVRGYSRDNKNGGDIWDIQGARMVTVPEFQHDGYSFGFNFIRVDDVAIGQLILRGRRKTELADSLGYRSIRGLKFVGCLRVSIGTVNVVDFTSGLKFESNCHGTIGQVISQHCALESTADAAINFSGSGTATNQHGWTIGQLVVMDTVGSAVQFANPDGGKYSVSSFYLKNIGAHGFYAQGDAPDINIGNGTIENWGQQGSFQGINAVYGGGFHNITFRNSDNTKGCFNGSLVSGRQFSFRGIRKPDGNPDFSGTVNTLEASGSVTIPNGAGTINFTHNLIKQPTADQFTLTMSQSSLPSTAPGEIFISSIGASLAAINCRNIQGATGTTIFVRVRVPDTFTA